MSSAPRSRKREKKPDPAQMMWTNGVDIPNGFYLDTLSLDCGIVTNGQAYVIRMSPEEALNMGTALLAAYNMYVNSGGLSSAPSQGSA